MKNKSYPLLALLSLIVAYSFITNGEVGSKLNSWLRFLLEFKASSNLLVPKKELGFPFKDAPMSSDAQSSHPKTTPRSFLPQKRAHFLFFNDPLQLKDSITTPAPAMDAQAQPPKKQQEKDPLVGNERGLSKLLDINHAWLVEQSDFIAREQVRLRASNDLKNIENKNLQKEKEAEEEVKGELRGEVKEEVKEEEREKDDEDETYLNGIAFDLPPLIDSIPAMETDQLMEPVKFIDNSPWLILNSFIEKRQTILKKDMKFHQQALRELKKQNESFLKKLESRQQAENRIVFELRNQDKQHENNQKEVAKKIEAHRKKNSTLTLYIDACYASLLKQNSGLKKLLANHKSMLKSERRSITEKIFSIEGVVSDTHHNISFLKENMRVLTKDT